jgi:ankyrin repeat protein
MSNALKAAIEANDPEAAQKAIKGVKDLNRKLPEANTPVLYACEKGADRVIEVLLKAGAKGEKASEYKGDSPFAVAAEHSYVGVLECLWTLKQASAGAVEHALETALLRGREEVVRFILERIQPPISANFFRFAAISKKPALIQLLIKHGGDVNAREDLPFAKGMTPLHDAARGGRPVVMRMLVEAGANVNARDALGQTPLMVLATSLESIEIGNLHAKLLGKLAAKGTIKQDRELEVVDGLEAVKTLLELGADATSIDDFGNDAIAHYEFEMGRGNKEPEGAIIETLRKAGAPGSGPTGELMVALRSKDTAAVRAAIKKGADVNRVTPPPVSMTPLTMVIASGTKEEVVVVLLEAGADPNKSDTRETPLVRAAMCGNLPVVKQLIAAGGDIHALEPGSPSLRRNAYLAAEMNRKQEVVDYLKSIGGRRPKPTSSELLKPGVADWNDFSEVLVKADATKTAEALAKMIEGKVQKDVYGKSIKPGKKAFVVVRPEGMNWSNVLQVAPPPKRFEKTEEVEAFVRELAKAAGAPAMSVMYSDTSDAAAVTRFEPDGTVMRDEGWDHDTLEEMAEAMGEQTPEWIKKQLELAESDEEGPDSSERLTTLAEKEKFVVAAFSLNCVPKRKVEIDFVDHPEEVFEGMVFVSN